MGRTQETDIEYTEVAERGYALIRDPLLNKGSAFTERERDELGLHGLLPSRVNTMGQQERRVYAGIAAFDEPLEQYVALSDLHDRNEYLFHRVLQEHLEALMPIVYTPTVGLATQNFSHVFRRGRGVWITPNFRGRIAEILRNAAGDRDVHLIVATDNESILGIGDQGAGGMAISIGKLALYTAGAGISPHHTLPVSLDVGTDNPVLLDDELYLGWRHERLRGAPYDELVDEFAAAVAKVFPGALLQWEDFRKDNALAILDRHRDGIVSFNDDIQGTGAVALAGVQAAMRVVQQRLVEQRILILGAGAAGLGISRQLGAALRAEGLSEDDARTHIGVIDSRGLIVDDRQFRNEYKRALAWRIEEARRLGLEDPGARDLRATVEAFRPTVLVGASGQGGAFDEDVITRMAAHVERPVVMPFSNPTAQAEARPADVLAWTQGRALIATGSPFAPVQYRGRSVHVGQGNNVFVFPGLGLGALAAVARKVTDAMVSAAAGALAASVKEDELALGLLYPEVSRLREVSRSIALAVARQAERDGVAGRASAEVERTLDAMMWSPVYRNYTGI